MDWTGLELETNVSTLAVNQATGTIRLGILMPDPLHRGSTTKHEARTSGQI